MSLFAGRKVYISDSWMAEVGRYDGSHKSKKSFTDLVCQIEEIFKNSKISKEKIEAIVVGSQNPFAFSGIDNVAAKVAGILGISGVKSVLIDTASSSGASAFENAYLEVASGRFDNVLAIGIQKMTDVPTSEATKIVAGVIDKDEAEFGLTMPACGALVAQNIIKEFDLNEKKWLEISASLTERAHLFSSKNPLAHNNYPLSKEKYLNDITKGKNNYYYTPLRYYDFCPMSDGAAAVILTSTACDVVVSGIGSATDIPTIADRNTFATFPATVIASSYAYGTSGIKDIKDFAGKIHINMHDPFNGFGIINMIDLGIFEKENVLKHFFNYSVTGENGDFPTNITGGLRGRGHPLGATGLIQVVENHKLLSQGKNIKIALSHSIGGPINNNVVLVLEDNVFHNNRNPKPFKPVKFPKLGKMKPSGMDLNSIFSATEKPSGKFLFSTTRHDFKTGAALNSIILFSSKVNNSEFRFIAGTEGEIEKKVGKMKYGEKIYLQKVNGKLTINEIPIRKLYRKTISGIVEFADATISKLMEKLKKR